MRPRHLAIETEISLFDNAAPAMFGDSEDDKKMHAEYPQLREKLTEAIRAVLVARAPASEDRLRGKLLAILARELSPAEVSALTDFYTSSAGLAIVEQMNRSVSQLEAKTLGSVFAKDKLGTKDLDMIRTEASKGVSLTGRQEAALAEFMKSSTAQVLRRIQPKLVAAQAAHANEPDAEMDAEMERATNKVLEEVLGTKL
jgi:hypothetical protein